METTYNKLRWIECQRIKIFFYAISAAQNEPVGDFFPPFFLQAAISELTGFSMTRVPHIGVKLQVKLPR